MRTSSLKKTRIIYSLLSFFSLFKKTGIKYHYFLVAAVFSLIAGIFEGISVVVMIPLLKGIITLNFHASIQNKILEHFIRTVSPHLNLTNTMIFILLVVIVFLSALLKNIFQYVAQTSFAYLVRRFTNKLRAELFHRYLSFGKLFFDQTSVGYLQNLITDFPNLLSQKLFQTSAALTQTCFLIIYFTIMCFISLKLTFVIIITAPLFYFSIQWLIMKIQRTSDAHAYYYTLISKKIQNVLSCIPLVKAYANEDREERDFSHINQTVTDLEFSVDKKYILILPFQEMIMLIVMLFLISAMAFMVLKQGQEIGKFLVYFYILKKSINVLGGINNSIGYIATASGPISNITAIFESDKDIFFVKNGAENFEGLKKSIEIKNLNFSYPDNNTNALEGINLSIEKGKITAIVGETGAGKTTLINLLLRFYDCPPSTIFIDGTDIRRFAIKSLMAYMVMVSQEGLLFNDTLKSNIIYGLDRNVPTKELQQAIDKARLSDFINSLPQGMETLIGDRGTRLSGGEKQRLAIARALLKPADIIILDEATNALDTQTEKLIQEAISEAIKGKTAIIIAHRLSTIRNADKIIVIENGRLVETGSLNELLEKKNKFYQYWQVQKFF